MPSIYNENMEPSAIGKRLTDMDEAELIAQGLVQQGAVHAVSFLLQHGCTEAIAAEMLGSLRQQAKLIREEEARRGLKPAFDSDQTGFN